MKKLPKALLAFWFIWRVGWHLIAPTVSETVESQLAGPFQSQQGCELIRDKLKQTNPIGITILLDCTSDEPAK